MEEDYWEMGNLSLENYLFTEEVDEELDSENDLIRSDQASEAHYDAKVERCKRVTKTLEHQFSLGSHTSTFPFSTEFLQYVEPREISTTGDATDFSFQVVLRCNTNSTYFSGLINIFHDILTENSEQIGICPSSMNIVKNENVILFKILGDDGFLVKLCVAPAEIPFDGTRETLVQGQNS